MSVLIKGIEMPYRGCNECFLRHGNLCSRTKNLLFITRGQIYLILTAPSSKFPRCTAG